MLVLCLIISMAIGIWLDLSRLQGILLVVVLCGPALWLMDYRDRVVRVLEHDKDWVKFSFKHIISTQVILMLKTM